MKFVTLLFVLLSITSVMSGKKKRRRNRNDDKSSSKSDSKENGKNGDPCDCFSIDLQYGYPQRNGNEICYKYSISKNKDKKCKADLDYFIISPGKCNECGVELKDLGSFITDSSDKRAITVQHKGRKDGTKVNGIRIDQSCGDDDDQEFEICFDKTKVGGVQEIGTIGLVDSKGNGASCKVKDTLPDFCGGIPNNIIFILMDDLGYTDAGYYSNYDSGNDFSFPTPNIESLADKGIKLNSHYSEAVCSTTRSALLSGRYAWRTGVDVPLNLNSPYQTNVNFTFFPKVLQETLNYNTLMTGKWHVGYRSLNNIPPQRGFDAGLYFTSGQNHYSKETCQAFGFWDNAAPPLPENLTDERNALYGPQVCSYDLWDISTFTPYKEDLDVYNERIFTDKIIDFVSESQPFFVYYPMWTPHTPLLRPPIDNYTECQGITWARRETFCQMVIYADNLIGEIVDALKAQNVYDDTIIIFTSDNGPATGIPGRAQNSAGQTLPLRGSKRAKFEGGVKSAAFISGGYVENLDSVCDYNGLVHITDWYLTILQMAGLDEDEFDELDDIDGLDSIGLWDNILSNCDDDNDYYYGSDKDDDDDEEDDVGREMIISARMCEDDSFFINTYIRYNEWKLVVNGTFRRCPGPRATVPVGQNYWITYDGEYLFRPDQDTYEEYIADEEYGELFRSECYDNLDAQERNDTNNFLYDDIMLFNIETDAIEACDVKNDNMDVVEDLLQILFDNVQGKYRGAMQGVIVASSVWAQFEAYSCEFNETYLVPWIEQPCCNDDSFDDWVALWERAIEIKKECNNP